MKYKNMFVVNGFLDRLIIFGGIKVKLNAVGPTPVM